MSYLGRLGKLTDISQSHGQWKRCIYFSHAYVEVSRTSVVYVPLLKKPCCFFECLLIDTDLWDFSTFRDHAATELCIHPKEIEIHRITWNKRNRSDSKLIY